MAEQTLTPQQRQFADALLACGDAAAAAEAAGYSPRSAGRLQKNPVIRQYLKQHLAGTPPEPADLGAVASGDEVLRYLTDVMRSASGSQGALKAAELLGKRLGLFSEQGDGPPAPVIIDDIRRPSPGEAPGETP